jgi:hypothetical protein
MSHLLHQDARSLSWQSPGKVTGSCDNYQRLEFRNKELQTHKISSSVKRVASGMKRTVASGVKRVASNEDTIFAVTSTQSQAYSKMGRENARKAES